jgi:uncharacterized membrane protein (Fun14 family)
VYPESLIPTFTTLGGGFFAGIIVGYFLKKIIKILMFVVGGIAGLLLYLQQQQLISVNLYKLEAASRFFVTTFGISFDNITHMSVTTHLGIPLAGGLSAGLAIGFVKG